MFEFVCGWMFVSFNGVFEMLCCDFGVLYFILDGDMKWFVFEGLLLGVVGVYEW